VVVSSRAGVVTGEALIFWDPRRPGKKLDAIDTDQITPSDSLVVESLDRMDEQWKAGAFRYLMPDFRARVHSGQCFLIVGDRFAIGSSRETSPAALIGVGAEVGRELVVVCGAALGDIFRRSALNLGLHVVQSRRAVDDAQDGDLFTLDPRTRVLCNLTQGTNYTSTPLSPQEEAIRQSGGIIATGRRELSEGRARQWSAQWPEATVARTLTSTQQILWAHRVDHDAHVLPGATLRVFADLLPASDGSAPLAIHTFEKIVESRTLAPRVAAIANDHFVFNHRLADDKQTEIGRQFAERHAIRSPYYATPGEGIFHFYFPEQGLVTPGALIPGADSHSRAYGAYGALGYGVGSTTLGFGWAMGYVYFTVAPQRRVIFRGALQPWVSGKDVVLALLQRWGDKQAQGMSVEFVDRDLQLPISYRNTIANMMAEAEASSGIFAPDEITWRWFRERGSRPVQLSLRAGEDAEYEFDEVLDLAEVVPLVAKPFSPGNAYSAFEVARERLTFDKAFIGSCTNGSYGDLLEACFVVQSARAQGRNRAAGPFIIFPGSAQVAARIEVPEPRLGGESIANIFRAAGAEIRASWCGPCFGQGPDALQPGERAITSFNRNWTNRMGVGGLGYLASPAVVAASALLGYIAPPSELGLRWDKERFGLAST
jgi:3-isopropylmalate/(R)-2-methylmalate dehydratase large subunit